MSNQRPGFSFLVCPDGQMLRAQLARLLTLYPPVAGEWERHVYWGDEAPPPSFWEHITLHGLFPSSRAVLVRQAQLWPADVWKKISRILSSPSEHIWPQFCLEMPWDKGQPKIPAHLNRLPCMIFAERQGWVWKQGGLTEYSLKKYVQQRAHALSLCMDPEALEALCSCVPPDAQAIENELIKLAFLRNATLAQGSGTGAESFSISPSMIATGSSAAEGNIFSGLRQIQAGNLVGVWKEFSRSSDDGLLFALAGLLARECRMLWQLLAGEKVRMPPSGQAEKRRLAENLGAQGLAEIMSILVDVERKVKNGRYSTLQGLECLLERAAAVFCNANRAPAPAAPRRKRP